VFSGNLIRSCEDRYRGITERREGGRGGVSGRVYRVVAINSVNLLVVEALPTRAARFDAVARAISAIARSGGVTRLEAYERLERSIVGKTHVVTSIQAIADGTRASTGVNSIVGS